jgi:hypothetical protein
MHIFFCFLSVTAFDNSPLFSYIPISKYFNMYPIANDELAFRSTFFCRT